MSAEPKEMPSGSGTFDGYSVEARYASSRPTTLCGMVLDERWQPVHFDKSRNIGVPIGPEFHALHLACCGLMSYPAAEALRWWLHATAEAEMGKMCLETRIVKHAVRYSYGATRKSEHNVIGGDDRSSVVPDWGTKPTATEAAE